jgi:transposase
MEKKVKVITERIDDIVLLLNVMMQMGLPKRLNQHLPRHWKQLGLDWGWWRRSGYRTSCLKVTTAK